MSLDAARHVLAPLNDAQRLAAGAPPGPLLILAGAGTGKTRTLTHRAAYLIASGAAAPTRVLLVTFTNQAAREMAGRIGQLVGEEVAGEIVQGTLHAVCARWLRVHAGLIGRSARFSIWDRAACLRALRDELGSVSPEVSAEALLDEIARAKARLWDRTRLTAVRGERAPPILEGWAAHERALIASDALDLDDLLYRAVGVLSHSGVLASLQARFDAVLVDEAQDLNPAQYRLLALLSGGHRNLTLVADDDQAIYAWRSANGRALHAFRCDFPEHRLVRLEHNYRSTAQIVRAADRLIAHNRARIGKQLIALREGRAPVLVQPLDEREEGERIARWAARHQKAGTPLGELAALARTRRLLLEPARALAAHGITHRTLGGAGLFERSEIRDAIACLTVAVNPRDRSAFDRAVRLLPGIGAVAAQRIADHAQRSGMSLLDAARSGAPGLSARQSRAVGSWAAALAEALSRSGGHPGRALEEVLAVSGLLDAAFEADRRDGGERTARLTALQRAGAGWRGPGGLAGFLGHLATLTALDQGDQHAEAVTLSTVHAAKGREWAHIVLVAWEEDAFPHRRALDIEGGEEEERRLAYVALTRAKDTVAICRALERGRRQTRASRFISEAGIAPARPAHSITRRAA